MWKLVWHGILCNCLPGKRVLTLVITKQAGERWSLSDVSKFLGIYKKPYFEIEGRLHITYLKGLLFQGKCDRDFKLPLCLNCLTGF